jgi:hypothetical protein
MLKYNHLGIPTSQKKDGEVYLPSFKMYVSGCEASPYKIEWMRFEKGCPLPQLVQTVPHVAFEVANLAAALQDKKVIIEPNSPSPGVLVAFIEDNGAPVELMQISESTDK